MVEGFFLFFPADCDAVSSWRVPVTWCSARKYFPPFLFPSQSKKLLRELRQPWLTVNFLLLLRQFASLSVTCCLLWAVFPFSRPVLPPL